MKRDQVKLSQKKHMLKEMQRKGMKNPIWSLTAEELEYIHSLGFKTSPRIYRLTARTFQNVKVLPAILKELHYAKLNGKLVINRPIKIQEQKLLKEYGVKFKVLKHEVHLR